MAIVATIVGLMVLAAAAHYYFSNSGYGQSVEYQESYKQPEYQWQPLPRSQYNYEENSVDILPDPSTSVKFTTEWESKLETNTETRRRIITTTLSPETTTFSSETTTFSPGTTTVSPGTTTLSPETSTLHETTYFQVSTDIPHTASTRRPDNEIEYVVGAPNDVIVQRLKPKEFYKYKHNSEVELDPDGNNSPDMEFNPLGHPIARDPVFRKPRGKENNDAVNAQSIPTSQPVPSRAGTKSLLGYFLTIFLIIVVILQ